MSLAEERAVPPLDRVTAASAGTVHRHDTTETFESTDPASGAVVGVFPVHDADAVRATVERARPPAAAWRAPPPRRGRVARARLRRPAHPAGRLARLPRPPHARAGRPRAPRERQ